MESKHAVFLAVVASLAVLSYGVVSVSADTGSCTNRECQYENPCKISPFCKGNNCGSYCSDSGPRPDGSSCGGANGFLSDQFSPVSQSFAYIPSGVCRESWKCMPLPPKASVTHSPGSPKASDTVKFSSSGSSTGAPIVEARIFVDGAQLGSCTQGKDIFCYSWKPRRSRQWRVTCGLNNDPNYPGQYCHWETVCGRSGCYDRYTCSGPNEYTTSTKSISCVKNGGPYAPGTHTYYAEMIDGLRQVGTSTTGTFKVSGGNNFTISIDPTKGLANKGDSKDVNVTLTNVTGSDPASFSATGLPAGTTASFSPSSCTPTCYSNATITTTVSTPEGSHLISISGTSGSVARTEIYNLTVLASGVPATCGAPTTCDYPETQSNCPTDCSTTADIPSPVAPGEVVTVTVEFRDFRYTAGGKVKIDLLINPEGTAWTPANGCFFGGKKMGPTSGGGAIAWPPGTISEDGHFKIETSCALPGTIAAGPHTLVATPTIF